MAADGTGVQTLAEALDVNGAPSWSPDGKWIAVAAGQGDDARVFKVPVGGAPPVRIASEYSMDPVWSPDGHFLIYAGPSVGATFTLKAVAEDGQSRSLPNLLLSRGTRFRFVAGRSGLLVLKGGLQRHFYLVDLQTGRERQLTNLQPELAIQDFDISSDGREIIFDRLKQTSDIVLIDLPKQ
jgi:dipeptidyl aminopeptidase/acylaminoacyl peptidase